MAGMNLLNLTLSLIFIYLFFTPAISGENRKFQKNLSSTLGKEKLTHFRVYLHDVVGGPKPTAINIVRPLNNTANTGFGAIAMIDDALTLSPKLNSRLVGRAQGFYALTSQSDAGCLLMAMNFVFMEGKYNGSTISILGRNTVFSEVREMPIIGGSGFFRFARGYVQAKTDMFDSKSGDATVEYHVYVMHY